MIVKKRKIKKSIIIIGTCIIGLIILFTSIIMFYKHTKTDSYKLKKLGYKSEEITEILKMNETYIQYFKENKYDEIRYKVFTSKYFIFKNIDRYMTYYKNHNNDEIKMIISIVNSNMDKTAYDDINIVDISLGNIILVNKYYKIDETANFEDLTTVKNWYCYGTVLLRKEAIEHYIDMFNAAKEDNINIFISTGYRTYEKQNAIYQSIVGSTGTKKASTSSSKAGFSDHQTGLSVDIVTKGATSNDFTETEAYKWLINNSYKYGYILRYPENKTAITGFDFEPRHFRYVGIKEATTMHDEDLTLEEYYAYYVENK